MLERLPLGRRYLPVQSRSQDPLGAGACDLPHCLHLFAEKNPLPLGGMDDHLPGLIANDQGRSRILRLQTTANMNLLGKRLAVNLVDRGSWKIKPGIVRHGAQHRQIARAADPEFNGQLCSGRIKTPGIQADRADKAALQFRSRLRIVRLDPADHRMVVDNHRKTKVVRIHQPLIVDIRVDRDNPTREGVPIPNTALDFQRNNRLVFLDDRHRNRIRGEALVRGQASLDEHALAGTHWRSDRSQLEKGSDPVRLQPEQLESRIVVTYPALDTQRVRNRPHLGRKRPDLGQIGDGFNQRRRWGSTRLRPSYKCH